MGPLEGSRPRVGGQGDFGADGNLFLLQRDTDYVRGIYISIYLSIYIIFPSAFHFSPTKGAFSQDPLSFSPHDISKFRVRHETHSGV